MYVVVVQVFGNLSSRQVAENEWTAIEDRLVPLQMLNSMAAEARRVPDGIQHSSTYTGEAVHLHIRFYNPLALPLELKNVCLACVFSSVDQRMTSIPSDIESILNSLAPPDKVCFIAIETVPNRTCHTILHA